MSQTYFQTALTLGLLGHKNAMVFVQFSSDLRIHSSYVRKDITISKINLTNDICVFFVFLEAACCYLLLHGRQRQFLDTYKTAVNFRDHSWKSLLCFWLPFWQLLKPPIQWLQMQVKKREFYLFTYQKPPKLLNGKQEVPPLRKQIPKGRSKYPDDCDWDNLSL